MTFFIIFSTYNLTTIKKGFWSYKKADQDENESIEEGQESKICNKALERAIEPGKAIDPERATDPRKTINSKRAIDPGGATDPGRV